MMNLIKLALAIATLSIIAYNILYIEDTNLAKVMTDTKYEDTEHSLLELSKDSVTIQWESQDKEIGAIEYGMIKGTYYKSKTDIEATHTHSITLDTLKECTKYYFHVSSKSMLFDKENSHFTTLCDNAKITNKLNTKKEDSNE